MTPSIKSCAGVRSWHRYFHSACGIPRLPWWRRLGRSRSRSSAESFNRTCAGCMTDGLKPLCRIESTIAWHYVSTSLSVCRSENPNDVSAKVASPVSSGVVLPARSGETQPRVRIQSSPPISLPFSVSPATSALAGCGLQSQTKQNCPPNSAKRRTALTSNQRALSDLTFSIGFYLSNKEGFAEKQVFRSSLPG